MILVFFEILSVNSLKGDLSNDTTVTVNTPLFLLVNTFKLQKSVWPYYQFVMSKRRIRVVFSQIYLFKTFYWHFVPKHLQFFICLFK